MEILFNSTFLVYADDIIITGNTHQEVVTWKNDLMKVMKLMGLEINKDKTKYLVTTRRTKDNSDLVVGNYIFQQVEKFKYLGLNIN